MDIETQKGRRCMATIDLIVLGILKKEPMSAYDIQKLVEYRNISKWVKISTHKKKKKAIQLEEKGLIISKSTKGTFISDDISKIKDIKITELMTNLNDIINELLNYGLTKEEIIKKIK